MGLYQSVRKKLTRSFVCVASMLLVLAGTAVPAYPEIYALAIDPVTPSTLYAGTHNGVLKSVDGAATWNFTGLTTDAHFAVAIDPLDTSVVYAGGTSGIAKSTDGGATWSWLPLEGRRIEGGYGLAVAPTIPTTVYAAASSDAGRSLLKSTDGGLTWVDAGPPLTYVHAFAVDPLTPNVLYVAGGGNDCCVVFLSQDSGASWIEHGTVPATLFLVIDPVTPTTVYGGGEFGIFKSLDAGSTWVAAGPPVFDLAINPLTPTTLHALISLYICIEPAPWWWGAGDCWTAGDVTSIHRSRDGASTWSLVGEFVNHSTHALVIDPLTPTTLYSAGSHVLKSLDDGDTWIAISVSPPPPPDTSPPETSIILVVDALGNSFGSNASTQSRSLTFDFTGTDDVGLSRFECQLNGAAFSSCASPVTYSGLALGSHAFEVRAVDTSGAVDPTPARFRWTVVPDSTPPDTSIGSAVDGTGKSLTNNASADSPSVTFGFTGSDNAGLSGFECRLDGAAFSSCTSPLTYTGLTLGGHAFEVRAVDTSGMVDPTPARHQWTVEDRTAPNTLITSGPTFTTTNGQNTTAFTWTGSDNITPVATLTYAFLLAPVDTSFSAFGSATGTTYSGLLNGTYALYVKSRDAAGNEDARPAIHTFTINHPPRIVVAAPNGGQTWQTGTVQTISWNYLGPPGTSVRIILFKGGVWNRAITTGTPIGTNGVGSFNWTVPATQTPGTDYKVKVISTSNNKVHDLSDATVAIVKAPVGIRVLSPNGGETWTAGSTQTIRWSFVGNPGSAVRITLLKDGVLLRRIVASTPIGTSGGGAFTWSVPGGLAAGTGYQVRVISTTNSSYKDTSDTSLTITGSTAGM